MEVVWGTRNERTLLEQFRHRPSLPECPALFLNLRLEIVENKDCHSAGCCQPALVLHDSLSLS
jgi:hypothetical protein